MGNIVLSDSAMLTIQGPQTNLTIEGNVILNRGGAAEDAGGTARWSSNNTAAAQATTNAAGSATLDPSQKTISSAGTDTHDVYTISAALGGNQGSVAITATFPQAVKIALGTSATSSTSGTTTT